MNAKTHELSVVSRAASVTAQTLLALKKSLDELISSSDDNMDILVQDDQPISDRQKEFLMTLIRRNFVDKMEIERKIDALDSYSRADADLAIKELLGQ